MSGLDGDFYLENSAGSTRIESSVSGNLRLLKIDSSEQGLWRQVWDDSTDELARMLPAELGPVDTLDNVSQVWDVHDLAQKRAEHVKNSERRIPLPIKRTAKSTARLPAVPINSKF